MILRPPRSTRSDTLFPYTTLFRSFAGAKGFFTGPKRRFRPILVTYEARHLPARDLCRRKAESRARPRLHANKKPTGACRPLDKGSGDIISGRAPRWAGGPGKSVGSEERRVGKECVSTGRSRWVAVP